MKEVLVLGGGGFIGRNIVDFLVNKGDCNVTAADIKVGSNWQDISNDENKRDRFNFVQADFTNISSFENLNQSFDEIYMLAAIVGVNRTLKFPQDVIRTNTLLTLNTLDWISRNPIKRLLFSSSSENYAATSDLFKQRFLLQKCSTVYWRRETSPVDLCKYKIAWRICIYTLS